MALVSSAKDHVAVTCADYSLEPYRSAVGYVEIRMAVGVLNRRYTPGWAGKHCDANVIFSLKVGVHVLQCTFVATADHGTLMAPIVSFLPWDPNHERSKKLRAGILLCQVYFRHGFEELCKLQVLLGIHATFVEDIAEKGR
jgi:hypothetical protein